MLQAECSKGHYDHLRPIFKIEGAAIRTFLKLGVGEIKKKLHFTDFYCLQHCLEIEGFMRKPTFVQKHKFTGNIYKRELHRCTGK